jgi:hypothetical protein
MRVRQPTPHAHSFVDVLEITSIEIFFCLVQVHSNSAVYSAICIQNVETVVREMQYYFIIPYLFIPLFLVPKLHTDRHNET